MSKHDQLRAGWERGQVWETRIEGYEQWVLVGGEGRAEPVWAEHQEYRERPPQEWKLGGEFLPFHPQASHVAPEYRDGWNHCYRAALAHGAKP